MWPSKRFWCPKRGKTPTSLPLGVRRPSRALSGDDLIISIAPTGFRRRLRWEITDVRDGKVIASGTGTQMGLAWADAERVFRWLTGS